MKDLQTRISYRFRNEKLLQTALTHPSYGGDYHVDHYQRLEFLGDAVLEVTVSEYLFNAFPALPEGRLTRMRAELVREETLAEAAARLGIDQLIRLSVGEERSGGREKSSILCDVMEAVIGAVYLDGGKESAEKLIMLALDQYLHAADDADQLDAKSQLQAILQKDGEMPEYEAVSVLGPPHMPTFTYRVLCQGNVLGEGAGHSKQAAQQAAAKQALASGVRLKRS